MKLTKISALCLAASSLFAASSAMAWESEDGAHSVTASVALSSDYVWRGISQTLRDPAISGSFDYAHSSGFYAGVWASNVDFGEGDSADLEVDTYAGFANEFGDSGIGYDIGWLRYIYPGTAAGVDYDWNEYHVGLSYSYFSASVNYSDEVYGSKYDAIYYTLGAAYEFENGVGIDANVGYYDYDTGYFGVGTPDNALDWNIGVSKEFVGLGFDLRYYDSDSDLEKQWGTNSPSDSVVFTISKSM